MIKKCPRTGKKYETFDQTGYHRDTCPYGCNNSSKTSKFFLFGIIVFFFSLFVSISIMNDSVFKGLIGTFIILVLFGVAYSMSGYESEEVVLREY